MQEADRIGAAGDRHPYAVYAFEHPVAVDGSRNPAQHSLRVAQNIGRVAYRTRVEAVQTASTLYFG